MNFIGHIDIAHQRYLWCLTYILCWRKCCMLTDYWGCTNFRRYRLLLQQPWWYLPHTLCFHFVCCVRTILGIYLWWDPYARFPVMRSDITGAQYMGYHLIIWWVYPSWDCMMHPQLKIHQCFCYSPPSGGLLPDFPCLRFLDASAPSFRFVCVYYSLFPA